MKGEVFVCVSVFEMDYAYNEKGNAKARSMILKVYIRRLDRLPAIWPLWPRGQQTSYGSRNPIRNRQNFRDESVWCKY